MNERQIDMHQLAVVLYFGAVMVFWWEGGVFNPMRGWTYQALFNQSLELKRLQEKDGIE